MVLGCWVLGNIHNYWVRVVMLLGDIFVVLTPSTIPIRQQSTCQWTII